MIKRVVQQLMRRVVSCWLAVGVDDAAAVAQVFVERDFGDVQALSNLIDAQLLLPIERNY